MNENSVEEIQAQIKKIKSSHDFPFSMLLQDLKISEQLHKLRIEKVLAEISALQREEKELLDALKTEKIVLDCEDEMV